MDVMEPGRCIGRDISVGERTEAELAAMIERRHEARVRDEGERPAEEAWMESERRHSARRREENDAAWCQYHREQAARHRRNLEALIRRHEAAAARLGGAE